MAGGRPSDYREEYAEQAYNYCLLGATDAQLAVFFDVSETTINNWKLQYPEFLESLKRGKEMADAEIAQSLHKSAKGYSHPDVDIKVVNGEIVKTPIIKYYPPNPTSAIFWLKNRQPKLWREKREAVEVDEDSGEITINVRRVGKDAN